MRREGNLCFARVEFLFALNGTTRKRAKSWGKGEKEMFLHIFLSTMIKENMRNLKQHKFMSHVILRNTTQHVSSWEIYKKNVLHASFFSSKSHSRPFL